MQLQFCHLNLAPDGTLTLGNVILSTTEKVIAGLFAMIQNSLQNDPGHKNNS